MCSHRWVMSYYTTSPSHHMIYYHIWHPFPALNLPSLLIWTFPQPTCLGGLLVECTAVQWPLSHIYIISSLWTHIFALIPYNTLTATHLPPPPTHTQTHTHTHTHIRWIAGGVYGSTATGGGHRSRARASLLPGSPQLRFLQVLWLKKNVDRLTDTRHL